MTSLISKFFTPAGVFISTRSFLFFPIRPFPIGDWKYNNFYNEKEGIKTLNEANLNKVLYYDGKQAVLDILNFKIIKSKKLDKKMLSLLELYENKITPSLPVGADLLMTRYKIPEGRQLGSMLKLIEEEWVRNNFEISDKQIDNIVKS